jgi:predicted acyltransferase (DUF342 family)
MTLAKRLLFILALSVMAGAQAALPPQLEPPLDELTIYSGAAITMGASSIVSGNIMVEAAATLGASSIVSGFIVSGAAVTLGATASVGGYIEARDAGTIGADSTIGGYLKTGDAAPLGANTIDGNIMVDGDLTAGAAILVGTKAVITGNLRSGAAASADLGADGIVGGSATAGTALTLGADVIVSGHAQAGTGAVALGVNAAVAGNARAGTSVTLAAGASVGGNITPGSIEQFTNDPKEPIDDQSPQILQLQTELAAMVAPAANQLPASMTVSTTLKKGVYHTTAITTTAGITLTFDGEGVEGHWLINSDSFIAFGASTKIKLLNVTDNSTITWNAGSYTEVGASAELKGTFFAGSYILTGESTKLEGIGGDCGGMFTATGAVTFGASNLIGSPGCTVAGLDHFVISYDTSGIHCAAEMVSVAAKNKDGLTTTDYTGTIILDTQTGKGSWSSFAGNQGSFVDATVNDGLATYAYTAADNGVARFSLYYPEGTANFNIDAYDGDIRDNDLDSNITFSASGFTVTASPLSNPPPNPIDDSIGTQTAGSSFFVYLTAYGTEATATDSKCGIIETYTGSKNLTQTTTHVNPSSGAVLATGGSAITFTNGQTFFSTKYKDAGQIRLTFSDAIISGSSSDFVVKPASFDIALSGSNQTASDQDGSVYISAGSDFTITVTAKDSEGDTTPNFGRENSAVIPSLTHSLFSPNPGVAGNLSGNLSKNSDPAEFTGSFNWSEVGIINLTASIEDYLSPMAATDADVSSTLDNVGRFTPASFSITLPQNGVFENANASVSADNTHTYIGQPFSYGTATRPAFTLNALNASGGITQNYSGDWSKLIDTGIDFTKPRSDRVKLGSTSVLMPVEYTKATTSLVIPSGNGTFNFEFTNDSFVYTRDANSRVIPFEPTIDLIIVSITDSDSITTSVVNTTLTPVAHNTGNTDMRFGRLRMDSAHESDQVKLLIPMRIEIFNEAKTFEIHTDDTTTQITDANLMLLSDDQLSTTGASTLTIEHPTVLSGILDVNLSPPGDGIEGYIDVTPDLSTAGANLEWLRYDWSNGTNAFNENPTARATFGIYKGNSVYIYIQ